MLKQEVIIIACAFQQKIHNKLSNNNKQRNVELGVTVKSMEPATFLVGASQRTERLFQRYIVFNSTRACANRCTFVIRDSACLSKQLKNGSSRPRASEAADRGKHSYPDGELKIAENPLKGGASLGSQ